ncbi:hypothetical protein J421_3626 [Gemmatirosa kalamazoonensis]|uniref:Quinol:cytochrome c oxidoreductase quinone-binding subunit 2 n=1 Tax=Gemmatirosa kalamazoonensis TaxID=861299 RepID=W0RNW7_9BACT|nr:hypothetical protein [Gemmatirosa kalamazoonensis]AHG91163.1 hypothetical protein J421_3626 [Gemmatirosa kalamazoonensis]
MSLHAVHVPTREELIRATANKPVPRGIKLACAVLAAIGAIVFIFGAVTGQDRAWLALQFNWTFFTIVSSAGVAFAAVQRLTTARWSRPVVRFAEGYVGFLPVAFLLLLLMLFVGHHHIYAWAKETVHVDQKREYLDPTFFRLRGIVIFGLITFFSWWFVQRSVRLDVGITPEDGTASGWARGTRDKMRRAFGDERRELHSTHSLLGKLAAVICLLYGYGWSVLIWDYSMTISLHFQSTMYSWQVFMGAWLVMLFTLAILVRWWRAHLNAPDLITESHYHDIGKLCFAFTAFWGYLTFAQYLVIWYGNMPEETHYFRLRLIQPWMGVTTAVAVLVFVIPFFGLLGKYPKLYSPWMLFVACCGTIGMWLHRYLEIYPSVFGGVEEGLTGVPFGLFEIFVSLGMLGLWGLCYASFMDAYPKMRIFMMTSPFRDEVQVPVDPETMEPLPAHE